MHGRMEKDPNALERERERERVGDGETVAGGCAGLPKLADVLGFRV